MPWETLLALTAFAFVTSISPGPSNFMLLTSGANFGYLRTFPQVLGITIGFTSLLLAVGFGLGALLAAFPPLNVGLKALGGAYLLYLAWRIAMSRALGQADKAGERPLTFFESAAFQWINPKGWVVALGAMATYTSSEAPIMSVALICVTFALVNLPTVSVWAGFGVIVRRLLSDPARLRWFNITMGILLAATLWPVIG